jgi:initiation factor 1A
MGGKNIQGGSSHKKFGRKYASGNSKNNRLRTSENECEIYAIATKMLGNNMFHCHCIDEVVRLCHIRGKFTGRSKRDNFVECGKWILIGLREWSNCDETMQHADLLEVYNEMDKQRLKESVTDNWIILDNNDVTKETLGGHIDDSDNIFGTDKDFERDRFIEEMKSSTTTKITLNIDNDLDEEVDINDI